MAKVLKRSNSWKDVMGVAADEPRRQLSRINSKEDLQSKTSFFDQTGSQRDVMKLHAKPTFLQMALEKSKKARLRQKLKQDAIDLQWMRELEGRLASSQRRILCLAMGGLLLALIIREVCEVRCRVKDDTDMLPISECTGFIVNALKVMTTATTFLHCYLMWTQLDTKDELLRVRLSLLERARGRQVEEDRTTPSRQQRFAEKCRKNLLQVLVWIPINLVHPVPGVSRTFVTAQLNLFPVYRMESLTAAVMVLRIIHVFIYIRLRLVIAFLNLDSSLTIRNERAVLLLNDPGLSQSTLALKMALMRSPTLLITLAWLVLILSTTVVIRLSESTEGIDTSPYMWDQLWLVIVTATTTGYGDINPLTHFGRFGCIVCMLSGPILVSVMTATLSRSMTLSRREEQLMDTLDHDKLAADLQTAAATLLQSWWRDKSQGLGWPPPLSNKPADKLYQKIVVDLFESKRLFHRHLLTHTDGADVGSRWSRHAGSVPVSPARRDKGGSESGTSPYFFGVRQESLLKEAGMFSRTQSFESLGSIQPRRPGIKRSPSSDGFGAYGEIVLMMGKISTLLDTLTERVDKQGGEIRELLSSAVGVRERVEATAEKVDVVSEKVEELSFALQMPRAAPDRMPSHISRTPSGRGTEKVRGAARRGGGVTGETNGSRSSFKNCVQTDIVVVAKEDARVSSGESNVFRTRAGAAGGHGSSGLGRQEHVLSAGSGADHGKASQQQRNPASPLLTLHPEQSVLLVGAGESETPAAHDAEVQGADERNGSQQETGQYRDGKSFEHTHMLRHRVEDEGTSESRENSNVHMRGQGSLVNAASVPPALAYTDLPALLALPSPPETPRSGVMATVDTWSAEPCGVPSNTVAETLQRKGITIGDAGGGVTQVDLPTAQGDGRMPRRHGNGRVPQDRGVLFGDEGIIGKDEYDDVQERCLWSATGVPGLGARRVQQIVNRNMFRPLSDRSVTPDLQRLVRPMMREPTPRNAVSFLDVASPRTSQAPNVLRSPEGTPQLTFRHAERLGGEHGGRFVGDHVRHRSLSRSRESTPQMGSMRSAGQSVSREATPREVLRRLGDMCDVP